MNTIILGLGNLLFADDRVGLLIARVLHERVKKNGVTVVEAQVAGLDVLEIIDGYDTAIIVDAIQTENGQPGSIYRLSMEQVTSPGNYLPHSIDLMAALNLAKELGVKLPHEIVIFAVEAKDITSIKEECTPEVRAAVPLGVEMVLQELEAAYTCLHG